MKRYLLLPTILCLSVVSWAQYKSGSVKAKNSVFLEVAGSTGSLMGLCYDGVISVRQKSFWSFTTGLGFFPGLSEHSDPIIGVPIIFNHASGLKKSHFEVGIGATYSSGLAQEYHEDLSTGEVITRKLVAVYAAGRIGYRLQNTKGGFVFKISLNPMLKIVNMEDYDGDYGFLLQAGLAFGWAF